jgi:hypothetical protein
MGKYILLKITILMGIHIVEYGYRIGFIAFIYSACLSRVPTYVRGYRTLYLQSEEEFDEDGTYCSGCL